MGCSIEVSQKSSYPTCVPIHGNDTSVILHGVRDVSRLTTRGRTQIKNALPRTCSESRGGHSGRGLLYVEETQPIFNRISNGMWTPQHPQEVWQTLYSFECETLSPESLGNILARDSPSPDPERCRIPAADSILEAIPLGDNRTIPGQLHRWRTLEEVEQAELEALTPLSPWEE